MHNRSTIQTTRRRGLRWLPPITTAALALSVGALTPGVLAQASDPTQPVDLQFYRSDLNYDGVLDQKDMDIMLAHAGADQPDCREFQYYSQGDINRDGIVDTTDVLILTADIAEAQGTPAPAIPVMPWIDTDQSYDKIQRKLVVTDCHGAQDCQTNSVTIIDTNVAPNGNHRVWDNPDNDPANVDNHIEPSIKLVPHSDGATSDGFDLLVTWDNQTGADAQYGRLLIPGILFGPDIRTRRFASSSEEEHHFPDESGPDEWYRKSLGSYPEGKYAPGVTLRGFVDVDPAVGPGWPDATDYPVPIGQMVSPDHPPMSVPIHTSEPQGFREYVMAVSVLYPVLEYKFATDFLLQRYRNPTSGAHYWNMIITPNPEACPRDAYGERQNNCGNAEDYPTLGAIPDGETREIRIQVRFYRPLTWYEDELQNTAAHRGDFLRLFQGYRRYFKQTYGTVQHERDIRPVKAVVVGGAGSCDPVWQGSGSNAKNPWGLQPHYEFARLADPSGDGWAHYTQSDPITGEPRIIERNLENGFMRQMLWGPSGAVCPSGFNWPFFVPTLWDVTAAESTNWSSPPVLLPWDTHPILSTVSDLGAWMDAATPSEVMDYGTRDLGFWWGRSVLPTFDVLAGSFDQELLDICQVSAGRAAALHELAGMSEAGVTMVGLDIASSLDAWDRYWWLKVLEQACEGDPDCRVERFITEAWSADFVHTIQPTFFMMYKENEINARGPHEMRDFLNQEAESWAHVHNSFVPGGGTEGDDEIENVTDLLGTLERFADWGYSIVVHQWFDGTGQGGPPEVWDLTNAGLGAPQVVDPAYLADDSWLEMVPTDLHENRP